MIVIATGFIPLSPLSIVSIMTAWESSQWLGKNIVRSTGQKELQESMDRRTGRRDINEILLKTALNIIHSINQSINQSIKRPSFHDGQSTYANVSVASMSLISHSVPFRQLCFFFSNAKYTSTDLF